MPSLLLSLSRVVPCCARAWCVRRGFRRSTLIVRAQRFSAAISPATIIPYDAPLSVHTDRYSNIALYGYHRNRAEIGVTRNF